MQVFWWCSGCHSLFQGMNSLSRITAFPALPGLRNSPSISFCQTELLVVSASFLEPFSEPCFCRRSSFLSAQHPSCPFSVLAPFTGLFLKICAVMDGRICSQENPVMLCPLPLLSFPFLACVSQGQSSGVPEPAPPASP